MATQESSTIKLDEAIRLRGFFEGNCNTVTIKLTEDLSIIAVMHVEYHIGSEATVEFLSFGGDSIFGQAMPIELFDYEECMDYIRISSLDSETVDVGWRVWTRTAADGLHEFIIGRADSTHLSKDWDIVPGQGTSYGEAHAISSVLFAIFNPQVDLRRISDDVVW